MVGKWLDASREPKEDKDIIMGVRGRWSAVGLGQEKGTGADPWRPGIQRVGNSEGLIANSKLQHSVPGPWGGCGEEAKIIPLWSRGSLNLGSKVLNTETQSGCNGIPKKLGFKAPRTNHEQKASTKNQNKGAPCSLPTEWFYYRLQHLQNFLSNWIVKSPLPLAQDIRDLNQI